MVFAAPSRSQPADRCPYRGPFTRSFHGCPTFRPAVFAIADSTEKMLGTGVTCAHLQAGEQTHHHYYPRCAIGTSLDRREWLGVVGPERLAVARAINDAFEALNAEFRDRLLAAKSDALLQPQAQEPQHRLEALVEEFIRDADAFIDEHAGRLEEVGLPAERVRLLVKEWTRSWGRSNSLAPPAAPAGALAGLGPVAAALLQPGPIDTEAAARTREEPLYDDSRVRVETSLSPPRLTFLGDIDASNLDAVERILAGAPGAEQPLQVDLSGVTFCDIGALRALVRASMKRPITIVGITPQIERSLRVAGWAGIPNLQLAIQMRPEGVA